MAELLIRHIFCIDKYRLVGNSVTEACLHCFQRLKALIILQRNGAHGVLCDIDFPGLKSRIKLASLYNTDIQLRNFRRSLPVFLIRLIGYIVILVKGGDTVRATYYNRLCKPLVGGQLCLRDLSDHMLWKRHQIPGIGILKGN